MMNHKNEGRRNDFYTLDKSEVQAYQSQLLDQGYRSSQIYVVRGVDPVTCKTKYNIHTFC